MSSFNEASKQQEPWYADIPLKDFEVLAQGLQYPQDTGALRADDNSVRDAGKTVGDYIRQARPANATSTT